LGRWLSSRVLKSKSLNSVSWGNNFKDFWIFGNLESLQEVIRGEETGVLARFVIPKDRQPIFLLGREVHRINRVAHYISCVVNPSNTGSCLVKVLPRTTSKSLHRLHFSQYESPRVLINKLDK